MSTEKEIISELKMTEKHFRLIMMWAMSAGFTGLILEKIFAVSPGNKWVLVFSALSGLGFVYWMYFTKPKSSGKIEQQPVDK